MLLKALADPAHDWYGLAIADRLVARAIGAFIGGLAAIGDQGVVAGEALEPFALARGEATNPSIAVDHGLATTGAVFTGVEALALERMSNRASDAYGILLAIVPPERVCLIDPDIRVLGAVDNEAFDFEITLLAFGNQSCRYIDRTSGTASTERGRLDVAS